MNGNKAPYEFKFFASERQKTPFVSLERRRLIGWHIINVYELGSYSVNYIISLHKQRLRNFKNSQLVIGSPAFHYELDEQEGRDISEMYGLYHVETDDLTTSSGLDQSQAEVHHLGLEIAAQRSHEKQS